MENVNKDTENPYLKKALSAADILKPLTEAEIEAPWFELAGVCDFCRWKGRVLCVRNHDGSVRRACPNRQASDEGFGGPCWRPVKWEYRDRIRPERLRHRSARESDENIKETLQAAILMEPGITFPALAKAVPGDTSRKHRLLQVLIAAGLVGRGGKGERGNPYRFWASARSDSDVG